MSDARQPPAESISPPGQSQVDPSNVSDLRRHLVLRPPAPYGAPAAAEGRGSVVAPLLAGFSFALIGLIVQSEQTLRWPGLALFLLASAGVLLIAVVQFTFQARQYQVSPSEARDWWPDWDSDPERRDRVYDELRTYRACHLFWIRRARWAYNAGICALLLGLATVLIPRSTVGGGGISPGRLAAVAVILAGLALEFALLAAHWLLGSRPAGLRRRLPLWMLDLAWWLASGNPAVRPSTIDSALPNR
jgi:disulfide bond formation protein DsbB